MLRLETNCNQNIFIYESNSIVCAYRKNTFMYYIIIVIAKYLKFHKNYDADEVVTALLAFASSSSDC